MIEAVSSPKFGSVSKAKRNGNAVSSMHSQAVIQDFNKLPNQLLENSLNNLGVLGKVNLSFKASLNSKEDIKETPEIKEIKAQLKKDIEEVLLYGRKMLSDADKEVKSELPSMEKDVLPLIAMSESGDVEASISFNKYIKDDLTTIVQYDKETGNCIKKLLYTNPKDDIIVYGYNEYQPDGTPKILTAAYNNGNIEEFEYDWPLRLLDDGQLAGGSLVKFNNDGKPVFYTQYGPFLSGLDMIKLDPETGKEILKVGYKDRYSMDFPEIMSKQPLNPKEKGLLSQVHIITKGNPNVVLNNEKDNYMSYCDRFGFISGISKGEKSYDYQGFEEGYEYTDGVVVRNDINGIEIPDFKA